MAVKLLFCGVLLSGFLQNTIQHFCVGYGWACINTTKHNIDEKTLTLTMFILN